MKRQILFIISFMCLQLIGCSQNEKRRINCICYIDYSGSLSEKTLNDYIDIIGNDLMKNLNQYDRLIVLPIDEGSLREPVKLINEDMSKMNFTKHSDGFTHSQDSITKRIHNYVITRCDFIRSTLKYQKDSRKHFADQTNIVGAIQQSKNLFEINDEDDLLKGAGRFVSGKNLIITENIVVLFSDMINESEDANFSNRIPSSEKEIDNLLLKLKNEGKIPNLKDIKVFVNGRTGKSNQQVERIQRFWEKYFEIADAKLLAYGYDVGDDITQYLKSYSSVK